MRIRPVVLILISLLIGLVVVASGVKDAETRATSGPMTKGVQAVRPPAPVFTRRPANRTSRLANTFAWTGARRGVRFQCSRDHHAWAACRTPYTWVLGSHRGRRHRFAVRAVDVAGTTSRARTDRFRYLRPLPFHVSGRVGGLILGVWKPIALTVSNPNRVTLRVRTLTVEVAAQSTPPGCSSAANIELRQSDVTRSRRLVVPAHARVVLPVQGVSAPRIRLRNLPTVNQDVCKGKRFALSYSGTATN